MGEGQLEGSSVEEAAELTAVMAELTAVMVEVTAASSEVSVDTSAAGESPLGVGSTLGVEPLSSHKVEGCGTVATKSNNGVWEAALVDNRGCYGDGKGS